MKRNRTRYTKLRQAVWHRDGGCCRVCRRWCYDPHTHHIQYRSLGGKDEMANLVLLCGDCHSNEHAKRIAITGTADALRVERIGVSEMRGQ